MNATVRRFRAPPLAESWVFQTIAPYSTGFFIREARAFKFVLPSLRVAPTRGATLTLLHFGIKNRAQIFFDRENCQAAEPLTTTSRYIAAFSNKRKGKNYRTNPPVTTSLLNFHPSGRELTSLQVASCLLED